MCITLGPLIKLYSLLLSIGSFHDLLRSHSSVMKFQSFYLEVLSLILPPSSLLLYLLRSLILPALTELIFFSTCPSKTNKNITVFTTKNQCHHHHSATGYFVVDTFTDSQRNLKYLGGVCILKPVEQIKFPKIANMKRHDTVAQLERR